MPRANFILPYESGYTGHWEQEKRRKEAREWLRQRQGEIERRKRQEIERLAINSEIPK
jgi:hypothetical protein